MNVTLLQLFCLFLGKEVLNRLQKISKDNGLKD